MEKPKPTKQEQSEGVHPTQLHLLALNEDAHMVRLYMAFTAADFFNINPPPHVLI